MKTRFIGTILLLAAAAPLTFGQRVYTPPTPAQVVANEVARLTKLLTLTTAQQAEATTIFTTQQTALSGVTVSMQAAQTALKTAVQANNTSAILVQAGIIGSLTTREVEAQSIASASFYAILTPAQQTLYNQRHVFGGAAFGGLGGGFGQPRLRRN